MSLRRGNEVARAFEVALPDQVGVGRAENCGEMDDRRDVPHRPHERRRVKEVALHGGHAGRKVSAAAYERATIHACLREAR